MVTVVILQMHLRFPTRYTQQPGYRILLAESAFEGRCLRTDIEGAEDFARDWKSAGSQKVSKAGTGVDGEVLEHFNAA